MATVTKSIQAKAERLIEEQRVHRIGQFRYRVEGDSGEWNVHLSYPQEASGRCDCPSEAATCSHIFAASVHFLANPYTETRISTDVFEGLN